MGIEVRSRALLSRLRGPVAALLQGQDEDDNDAHALHIDDIMTVTVTPMQTLVMPKMMTMTTEKRMNMMRKTLRMAVDQDGNDGKDDDHDNESEYNHGADGPAHTD